MRAALFQFPRRRAVFACSLMIAAAAAWTWTSAAHARAPHGGYTGTPPILADGAQPVNMKLRTLKQVKREALFRATVHQQHDFSCGSAAIATLLTYHYGRPVDEATAFNQMFEHGDRDKIRAEGFSLLDMKRYLEALGYQADGVQVPLDELVKVGVPAIALINDSGYRHFVVVKGMRDDRVVVGDPALGARILPKAQFEAARLGGIFFVIRSHLGQGRFNVPQDWQLHLSAPMALGVMRESLAIRALAIPDASRF